MNDVFSAPIKEGCEAAAKELGDTCYYIGPSVADEGQQLQVLNDVREVHARYGGHLREELSQTARATVGRPVPRPPHSENG